MKGSIVKGLTQVLTLLTDLADSTVFKGADQLVPCWLRLFNASSQQALLLGVWK
jgi:hypothetical protein